MVPEGFPPPLRGCAPACAFRATRVAEPNKTFAIMVTCVCSADASPSYQTFFRTSTAWTRRLAATARTVKLLYPWGISLCIIVPQLGTNNYLNILIHIVRDRGILMRISKHYKWSKIVRIIYLSRTSIILLIY